MQILIMRQIVAELGIEFTELQIWQEIYLSPLIWPLPSASPLEIQVAEGGAEYPDHDGTVLRGDCLIDIGVLKIAKLDSGERATEALGSLAESMLSLKERVRTRLDGSFLCTTPKDIATRLLVRPLIIRREGVVKKKSDRLVKVVTFSAGINLMWKDGE